MVEVLEQIPQKSVPQHGTKSTKRAPKSAFADFINNLGKTTSAKNNAESKNIDTLFAVKNNKNEKIDKNTQNAESRLDSAPKDKILSNILKGKNEEVKSEKTPQSPLESILSRPKATQVKFNQTPQIADSAENNNPSLRADSQNLRGNPPFEKTQDLQGRLPRSHSLARNDGILDSSPKAQNDKMGGMAQNDKIGKMAENGKVGKIVENDKVEKALDSAILANQNNSSLRADSQNLRGNPPIEKTQDLQGGLPRLASKSRNDGILDSSPTAQNDKVAESTLNPIKNEAQNLAKLGIANTLKYGAFKAFDALSLLKPSDGKKLSELIKKADELSLNLQNIKYTKMGGNKGNLGLDSAENNSSLRENPQDFRGNPPIEKTQDLQGGLPRSHSLARNDGFLDSSPKAQNDKMGGMAQNDKMETQNDKMGKVADNGKMGAENNKVKEVSDSIKADTTKTNSAESKSTEPKIIDSKSAESPLKNALETENNDLKPINFKAQNIAESKKETSLDSALNSTKDAIKDTKDTPKQTQENAPFANAQGASKIANQIFDARETMRHFAHNLRNEIQNHKPPLSKITIELQPAHLGSVEVSITSQGKNIQIQLHAQQNTLNLFIQNQSDLRSALTQAGYENVAMSFSNGAQMGFSDNSGKWRYESAQKSRNTFSLNENDENDEVFEIMITNNYA